MPQQKNTKPTSIYWLFDMRPETLVEYPNGRPFYCGKTVKDATARLVKHRAVARECPHRPIATWLNECGDYVRVQVMEIVSAGDDWAARERHWIATLRLLYPGCANVTDGGQGAPGVIPSQSRREKVRAALTGKKHSPERRARFSAAMRGKKPSVETLAKLSISRTGKKRSVEARARMSAAQKGRPGNKGLVHSAEARANMRAAAIHREQRKRENASTI